MTKKRAPSKRKLQLKKKAVARLSDTELAKAEGGTMLPTFECVSDECGVSDDCGGSYRFCWHTNHNQALRRGQAG
jgi:hypothetical protein